MITTKEYKVCNFEDLTDFQKEKVLDKNREWNVEGLDWWDGVYDDATHVASLLGIDIEHIYFSGFWSQGDGACVEGRLSHVKNIMKNIKEYAPLDKELHAIAKTFSDIYRKSFYTLTGRVYQRGHYNHERSMIFNTDYDKGIVFEDEVADVFADLACWIYKKLEKEYDYLTSDEVVTESLVANEMEFEIDDDGELV